MMNMENVQTTLANMSEGILKTDEILHFVNEVSVSSNLFGLNAAIEAARAGEEGRGFVVRCE